MSWWYNAVLFRETQASVGTGGILAGLHVICPGLTAHFPAELITSGWVSC